MHAAIEWLKAGTPAHWVVLTGAAYAVVEWALPRVKSVKARSVLEGIANVVGILIPAAKKFGTPAEVIGALEQPK